MIHSAIFCLALCGGLFSLLSPLESVAGEAAASPARPLEIYLLMGQSNMVGMEKPAQKEDPQANSRIYAFTANHEWVPAAEPLHGVGVGPGLSFARAMASHSPDTSIGLVPLAVGSTPISDWVKRGKYYQATLAQANLARRNGTIKGILWHQGESDSYDEKLAILYPRQLQGLVKDLRTDLNLPELPFVCGEIGKFLASPCAAQINYALRDLPNHVPLTATVRSDGLTNIDPWHFNAASANTLGQRYAKAMIELQAKPGHGDSSAKNH